MIENRLRAGTMVQRALASCCIVAATTLGSASASAGEGSAAAEVLFSEGKRLAQDGDFAAACPKFEESQKLDPGTGTLYRLADCYEHIGRTASAWAAFLEVASSAKSAGQQARADDAKKRADSLEPKLTRLLVRVTDSTLPGLVVKRGNVDMGRPQWNAPMPVDPGEVTVDASAPGYKSWHGVVAIQATSSAEIVVPSLEREVVASPQGAAASQTVAPSSSFGTQRTIAVAAGATGLVAIGVGGVFGLVSMSKKSDADKHCDANNACDSEGVGLRHDAVGAGNLSTLGFLAGGVLAATGIVLWVTSPRRVTSGANVPPVHQARIAPRWGGVSFAMELP